MKIQFPGFALFFGCEEVSHISVSETAITITTPSGEKKIIEIHRSLIAKSNPPESLKEAPSIEKMSGADPLSYHSRADMTKRSSGSESTVPERFCDIYAELKKIEDNITAAKAKFIVEEADRTRIDHPEEFIREIKLIKERCGRIPDVVEKMPEKTYLEFKRIEGLAAGFEDYLAENKPKKEPEKHRGNRKRKGQNW